MSLIQEALRRQQEEESGGAEPPAKTASEPVIRLGPKKEVPVPPPAAGPEPEAEVEAEPDPEMDFVLPVADSGPAEGGGLRLRNRVPEAGTDASPDTGAAASPADATESEAVRIKPTDPKSRNHNPVFHLLGVLLLLLLLLAAGAWAVVYGLQLLRREPSPPMAAAEATAPEAAPLPEPAEPLPLEALPTAPPAPLPGPPNAEIEAADAAPVVDEQPVRPDALPPGPMEAVADAAPDEPEPVREDTVASIPAQKQAPSSPAPDPSAPEPEAPADPEPVIWPFLQVTGVVGSGHSGSAMINGQIVDVGARIDGVRLLGIAGQAVRLDYQGEQRLVRVGRSTE